MVPGDYLLFDLPRSKLDTKRLLCVVDLRYLMDRLCSPSPDPQSERIPECSSTRGASFASERSPNAYLGLASLLRRVGIQVQAQRPQAPPCAVVVAADGPSTAVTVLGSQRRRTLSSNACRFLQTRGSERPEIFITDLRGRRLTSHVLEPKTSLTPHSPSTTQSFRVL